MSILIKGMEMPKSCIGCLFSSIESCDETEPPKIRCTIHGDFAHEVDWHEVCPLVEVPAPHGRLIDADAILGKINAIISAHPDEADLYEEDAVIVRDWLRSEPTIVEADHLRNDTKKVEQDRFTELRRRLFIMIGKALKKDPHHKSYEGAIELTFEYPNYFEDTAAVDYPVWYQLKIHCYVLGPQRHYELIGSSFDEVLDKFEQTLNEWESEGRNDDTE